MAKKEDILSNFIPINRELFEHYLWCEEREYSRFEAWLYLLKEARFEDTKVLDKGKLVIVKRGQIYASIRFLSTAFGWSTKKVGNYIQMLEVDKMVKRETVKETGQSIITICNYDKYNTIISSEETARKQQGNAEETKSNTVNTDNKEKLSNESKKKAEELKRLELEAKAKEQIKKLDAARAATLKRKNEFYDSLRPYVPRYGKEMIRAFFDYWTEMNKQQTRMRIDRQSTWDLALRLGTWNNRENIYGKTATEKIQQPAAGPAVVD